MGRVEGGGTLHVGAQGSGRGESREGEAKEERKGAGGEGGTRAISPSSPWEGENGDQRGGGLRGSLTWIFRRYEAPSRY